MEKDKHLQIVHQIRGSLSDEGKVSELLTEIADDYGKVISDLTVAQQETQRLKEANERLKEQNMNLFLKIGGNPAPAPKPDEDPEDKRRDFNSLFDEKGRLKK